MSGILIRRGSSLLAVAYGSSFSKSFIASNAAQQQLSTSSYPNNEITLYQYKICPFCNKVKAYLDYRGISYNTVEVNPITKSQIKTSFLEIPYFFPRDYPIIKIFSREKNLFRAKIL